VDLVEMGREIHDASERGDWTAAQGIAHKIKGTAGNMGALALQRQAAELESELKEHSHADISTLEDTIQQTLELCERFLAEMSDDYAGKSFASRDKVDMALNEIGSLLLYNRYIPVTVLETMQAAQNWGASKELPEKLDRGQACSNIKRRYH
jgi:HPt (histidine-containing phosphotransfer) domain-containing protein